MDSFMDATDQCGVDDTGEMERKDCCCCCRSQRRASFSCTILWHFGKP